jgi:hypothetical protein
MIGKHLENKNWVLRNIKNQEFEDSIEQVYAAQMLELI